MSGTNPEVLKDIARDPASLMTLLGMITPNVYYQGRRVLDLRSALQGAGGLYGGAAQSRAYEQALRDVGQQMPAPPPQGILQPISPGEAPQGPIQAMPMGEPGATAGGAIFPARPPSQMERAQQLMNLQVPSLQQLLARMPSEQFKAVLGQGIPGGVGRAPMLGGQEVLGTMREQAGTDIEKAKANVYAEAMQRYMADPIGDTDAKDAIALLIQGIDRGIGAQFVGSESARNATVRLLKDNFGIPELEGRKIVASNQTEKYLNFHFAKMQARETGTAILDQVEKMGVLPPESVQYWRGLVKSGLPLPQDFATNEAKRTELSTFANKSPELYRMINSKIPLPPTALQFATKTYPNLADYFVEQSQLAETHQLNVSQLRLNATEQELRRQAFERDSIKFTIERMYQTDALMASSEMQTPEGKKRLPALQEQRNRFQKLFEAQHDRYMREYSPQIYRDMTSGEVQSNIALWRQQYKDGQLKQPEYLDNIVRQSQELRRQINAAPSGPFVDTYRQLLDTLNKEWQFIQGKVVPPAQEPAQQGYAVAPGTTAPSVMAPGVPGLGYEAGKRLIESIMPKTPSAPSPPSPAQAPVAPPQPIAPQGRVGAPTPTEPRIRVTPPRAPEAQPSPQKPTKGKPGVAVAPRQTKTIEPAIPPAPPEAAPRPGKPEKGVSLPPFYYGPGPFPEDMVVTDEGGNSFRLPAGRTASPGQRVSEPYSDWQTKELVKQYEPLPYYEAPAGTMTVPPKGAATTVLPKGKLPKGKRPEDIIAPPTAKDREDFQKAWPKGPRGATRQNPPTGPRKYGSGEMPTPQEIEARVQSIFQKHWASMWPYTGGNYENMFPSNLEEIRGIAERQLLEGQRP